MSAMFQMLAFAALATVASADCAVAEEAAEASLFQFDRRPAAGACEKLVGQHDFVHQTDYNLISRFVRAFYEACEVVGLYTSTVETFPLTVVKMNNFSSLGLGVTSLLAHVEPGFLRSRHLLAVHIG